ncbi:MAG: efflux RND transporter periplasmic adaptor subunit [Pirellulales bacterium]|nr:efflux RND transporter periplasmic adaptor subunit [Pirellulales bacterium]
MASKLKFLVLLFILAAAGGSGYWYYRHQEDQPETGEIRVSGNIEVTDAEISFKIPGRVIKRDVDEGDFVTKGQEIARLEDDDLKREVDVRLAELEAAKAALAELEAGSRPQEIAAAKAVMEKAEQAWKDLKAGPRSQEIAAAEAAVKAAVSEKALAWSLLGRSKRLLEQNVGSREDFDMSKSRYEVSVQRYQEAVAKLDDLRAGYREHQIEQARAVYEQAKAQYELVKEGPRREDIEQAKARVQQAQAALKLAETRTEYAVVVSPLTGVVLSKNIEPGEYVAPGTPVVTVGDLENVWLRAYIRETDLGRVKVGQKAMVTVDSFPGRVFPGRVAFIAQEAEFTPKNVQTEKERVKLVYRIKIDINNKDMDLKPGMPADAVIETGK